MSYKRIQYTCPANSGDPGQMQHCVVSHLGLCCLPVDQSEIQSKKGAYLNTDNMKLYNLHDAWILKRQIVK